jgi:hypothetical protein
MTLRKIRSLLLLKVDTRWATWCFSRPLCDNCGWRYPRRGQCADPGIVR